MLVKIPTSVPACSHPATDGFGTIDRTGAAGNAVPPEPEMFTQVLPLSVVFQTFPAMYPPNETYATLPSNGSIEICVTARSGVPPVPGVLSVLVHVGEGSVPLFVM